MSSPRVTCDVHADGVAILTIDNPPVNAMTVSIARELGRRATELDARADVGVIIVTGAGERSFSAGSDITEFSAMLEPGVAVEQKLRPQMLAFSDLAETGTPTIAALNGLCLGGGLEIAVCCDLIVAEEHIRIGSPEITLGVFPSSAGTFRVARRIGPGRAKELQLLREPVSAATALDWGLVNRVAPRGGAMAAAHELAAVLLRRPPRALGLCKSVLNRVHDLPEAALTDLSLDASETAFTSPECAEGVRAFLAKQTPAYRPAPAGPAR
ncbi:enoyl-CoA hydratase/isomerase family protein [Pseudonocardia parietis]|uniref:Enoyl-CoA hydratase/carnithine racemase n=1 Tax=Pseudonocardia parietis TaxID=570936 RepID=A0ABS4VUQ6_9PSEU|nr:enoyl-CoA hydratase/isomerase family protein [Pseudonocardia parietis]MBP2367652.1 enoyl-CoA hydratase/carnithine racemase [Pseudonocardia parietis]